MFRRLISTLALKALRSSGGNVAVLFAISLPLVVGGAGLGAETTYWRYKQVQLQAAADAAAFAGAMEKRRGSGTTGVQDAAERASGQNGFPSADTTVTVTYPTGAPNAVQVELTTQASRFFTAYFNSSPVQLRAGATANFTNTSTACILALDPATPAAINVNGSAIVNLQGCSIMSNSIAADGAATGGSSSTTAPCILSAGGVSFDSTVNLTECDEAITEAAQAPDPYKTLAQPATPSGCKSASSGGILQPGHYCNGFSLNKDATLQPGDYIVSDEFRLNGNPTVTGDGVTIFLKAGARVTINGTVTVQLKARTTGTYAGILFFGDRTSTGGDDNVFNGTADSLLTGALYFPSQTVEYKGDFSGQGGCTQVVAKTIEWTGNATLSMNCSALGLQSVPLPGAVRLIG